MSDGSMQLVRIINIPHVACRDAKYALPWRLQSSMQIQMLTLPTGIEMVLHGTLYTVHSSSTRTT